MANDKQPPPVSTQLPFDIRAALVRAAATPVRGDPLARARAIEAVVERARLTHPHLFREEPCIDSSP